MVHQFSCRSAGYNCSFFLDTVDVDQLVHHVQGHATRKQDGDLLRTDVEDHVTEVQA